MGKEKLPCGSPGSLNLTGKNEDKSAFMHLTFFYFIS
jgi:hypothetical protein